MNLSITKAWDETSAFVKHDAGPLFLIAFGLGVLPGIILQFVAGRLIGPAFAVPPGTTPDFGPFLAALPVILILLVPVIALSIWGHLTIATLALRRETVIGAAFRAAVRRILPLFGATLLLVLAAIVVTIPMLALVGIGTGTPRLGLLALVFLLLWLAFVFVAIRVMLMTPVAAAESVGPIAIVRRSWELTAGHFWKLLGFLLLIMIVLLVCATAVGAAGGILLTLTLGEPKPGTFSWLVLQLLSGVLQAIFVTYMIVVLTRIYAQLTGNAGSVGQVFE
jgi:hypothetical protein